MIRSSPANSSPQSRKWAPLAFLAGTAVIAWAVAMAGWWDQKADPRLGFVAVLTHWGASGWPAIIFVLSAFGWGQRCSRLLSDTSNAPRFAISSALGLAFLLFLGNVSTSIGLGPIGAWTIVTLGLAGLARTLLQSRARQPSPSSLSPWRWLALTPAGFLLAAACNPPGWLFDTEFGGYDSLAYHLALPQEWLQLGRLQPLNHNLFSFFPSYVESAFMLLGSLSFAPSTPDALGSNHLLADGGHRLLSAQMLHALITLQAAWMLGPLIRVIGARSNVAPPRIEAAVAACRLAFLLTPWTIVVGALSYNEMPMLVFLTAGLLVLFSADTPFSVRHGIVLGLLCAAAIGSKPTAAIFVAAPLAVGALVVMPRRVWLKVAVPAAIITLLGLSPWLIRNAIHAGNPFFPFALQLLGPNHWNAEQVDRFNAATHFTGSTLDRLKLIFLPDPADPAGPRHRGLMHPQWLWLWLMTPLGLLAASFAPSPRRPLLILAVILTFQLISWLFLTHIQARFLLPCMPILLAIFGAALAHAPARLTRVVIALLALRGLATYDWYSLQRGGQPNRLIEFGPAYFSGHAAQVELKSAQSPAQALDLLTKLPPAAAANLSRLDRVYLIGEATPLYWNRPISNSTWDPWPIFDALESSGNDPWSVNDFLKRLNIRHVFINSFELERLTASRLIDPRLNLTQLRDWAATCTEPVVAWPQTGSYLLRLKERPSTGG